MTTDEQNKRMRGLTYASLALSNLQKQKAATVAPQTGGVLAKIKAFFLK